MPATLKLNRFELMWLAEGAIGRSHLRWDVYPMFVNDVWSQLTDGERDSIYTYMKRDNEWKFEAETEDDTAKEYWLQLLARYNPSNQYTVVMKQGRKKETVDNAYLWDGKYYVGWNRHCEPAYIESVKQKPYTMCANIYCSSCDKCKRYKYRKDGDKTLDSRFACEHCDMLIEDDGE